METCYLGEESKKSKWEGFELNRCKEIKCPEYLERETSFSCEKYSLSKWKGEIPKKRERKVKRKFYELRNCKTFPYITTQAKTVYNEIEKKSPIEHSELIEMVRNVKPFKKNLKNVFERRFRNAVKELEVTGMITSSYDYDNSSQKQ